MRVPTPVRQLLRLLAARCDELEGRLAASIRQARVGGAREQLIGVASMVHLDRERVRELLRYVRWLERDAAEGAPGDLRPITRSVLRRGCSISTAELLRSAVLAGLPEGPAAPGAATP
jgi:hypothetical protein